MKATSFKVEMVNRHGVVVGCTSQTGYSPAAAMLAAEAAYPDFAAYTAEPLAPFDYSCVGGMMASRNSDRLSRAASAVLRVNREHEVAADRESAFDGGEFSGPQLSRMALAACREAVAAFGFTPQSYNDALTARGCGRVAYFMNLFVDVPELD